MNKVAIIQSSYLPWKGYFDIINEADVFVFLDVVQYTKRDWRNRNKIKFNNHITNWITIPVSEDRLSTPLPAIENVYLPDMNWQQKHLQLIEANYKPAPFYKEVMPLLKEWLYHPTNTLSALNQFLIKKISEKLKINTLFINSSDLKPAGKKNGLLVDILKKTGADTYLSGPRAKAYLDIEKLNKKNIRVEWKDYSGYPEYKQLYGAFDPHVSIIDLLFNVGIEKAPAYIWGWRRV